MTPPDHPPVTAVVGAAIAVTVPVVAKINIGGYPTEIVSLALSILTVLAARLLFGFNDRTPGATRREVMRALIAAIFVFSYDLSQSPGPGAAVLVGGGVGVAITPILDLLGGRAVDGLRAFLDRLFGPAK